MKLSDFDLCTRLNRWLDENMGRQAASALVIGCAVVFFVAILAISAMQGLFEFLSAGITIMTIVGYIAVERSGLFE